MADKLQLKRVAMEKRLAALREREAIYAESVDQSMEAAAQDYTLWDEVDKIREEIARLSANLQSQQYDDYVLSDDDIDGNGDAVVGTANPSVASSLGLIGLRDKVSIVSPATQIQPSASATKVGVVPAELRGGEGRWRDEFWWLTKARRAVVQTHIPHDIELEKQLFTEYVAAQAEAQMFDNAKLLCTMLMRLGAGQPASSIAKQMFSQVLAIITAYSHVGEYVDVVNPEYQRYSAEYERLGKDPRREDVAAIGLGMHNVLARTYDGPVAHRLGRAAGELDRLRRLEHDSRPPRNEQFVGCATLLGDLDAIMLSDADLRKHRASDSDNVSISLDPWLRGYRAALTPSAILISRNAVGLIFAPSVAINRETGEIVVNSDHVPKTHANAIFDAMFVPSAISDAAKITSDLCHALDSVSRDMSRASDAHRRSAMLVALISGYITRDDMLIRCVNTEWTATPTMYPNIVYLVIPKLLSLGTRPGVISPIAELHFFHLLINAKYLVAFRSPAYDVLENNTEAYGIAVETYSNNNFRIIDPAMPFSCNGNGPIFVDVLQHIAPGGVHDNYFLIKQSDGAPPSYSYLRATDHNISLVKAGSFRDISGVQPIPGNIVSFVLRNNIQFVDMLDTTPRP